MCFVQITDPQKRAANMRESMPAPGQLCSVLVPSCDCYADLWKPFWNLFWRYWPDCPFPVYLGSNQDSFDHPRVQMIHAGGGNNWTNRVRQQILALDTPYVLMILEDFFLQSPVNTGDVLACLWALRELDGVMLRLIPRPAPDKHVKQFPMLGRCSPGALYRVSTQTAIWRRDALLELMREGESIWEFEIIGSGRCNVIAEGFYCTWKPVMTYRHHVVERGMWFRNEARKFGRMNIGCDFTHRPIMSRWEMLRWRYCKTRSVILMPYFQHRALREWRAGAITRRRC